MKILGYDKYKHTNLKLIGSTHSICFTFFLKIIYRRMEWRHFEFIVSDVKQIKVRNCENDAKDELDLKDRVIKMSAGFGYLIAITPSQCYIFRLNKI